MCATDCTWEDDVKEALSLLSCTSLQETKYTVSTIQNSLVREQISNETQSTFHTRFSLPHDTSPTLCACSSQTQNKTRTPIAQCATTEPRCPILPGTDSQQVESPKHRSFQLSMHQLEWTNPGHVCTVYTVHSVNASAYSMTSGFKNWSALTVQRSKASSTLAYACILELQMVLWRGQEWQPSQITRLTPSSDALLP